jgi:glycine hydroxymethyltransferase
LSKIAELLERHTEMRSSGINLIASENILSNGVRKALASDLAGRYHSDWYGGTRFAQEIIRETVNLAKNLFRTKHAIVTSLSGNLCDLAVMFAYTKPGQSIAMVPLKSGGYPLGARKFQRDILPLPVYEDTYHIQVDPAVKLIRDREIPLTILGSSFIPFPHPVREISDGIRDTSVCVYDGSHVLGLLACGEFQDPLVEGAEILIGSTHKSLYGPQGGLVLTDSDEHFERMMTMLDFDIQEGIGLVDNPHVNRVAALGMALEELSCDSEYGSKVVKNAQKLAFALDQHGIPVRFKDQGFTRSHQILLDIPEKEALNLCRKMEIMGIFIDIAGRIGTSEVTHCGMVPSDMETIAGFISEIYHNKSSDNLKSRISEFKRSFNL